MFSAGEIVVASFPFTSLTSVKRRPCVILAVCDVPDDFVVAFITSNPAVGQLPSTTLLTPQHPQWSRSGLKVPSGVRADRLATLNITVISGAIGRMPPDILAAVRGKLKKLLGL